MAACSNISGVYCKQNKLLTTWRTLHWLPVPIEESNHINKSNDSLCVSSGIEIQIFCLMKPSIGVSKEHIRQRNDNNVSFHCARLAVPSGPSMVWLTCTHHLGTGSLPHAS